MQRLNNPGGISSETPSQILIGKNYEKFKDLITYLRLAKGSGIKFVFIGCDHLGLIKELRERYKVVLPREGIVPFEVEVDREIESLYRLLKDELEKASITDLSNIVIFVYGLDKSILPYKEWPPFLATLNLSRDLFRNIPCPIVLCLSNDSLTKIANYAPDFWSWRGTVIEFEPVLPVEVKGAPEPILPETKAYRDMSKEDIRMYEEMIKEYKEVFKEEDATLANLLFELGMRYYAQVEFGKAIGYWNQALEIFKEMGDRQGESSCYGNLGIAYCSLGDFKKGIDYFLKSLKIMKEIGDKADEAKCYTNLGIAYQNLRDFKKAIEYYSKSLEIAKEIAKEIRDKADEAKCYVGLGIAYQSLGDFKQAIAYHSESLKIMKEIGDKVSEAKCYGNLGNAYYSLGNFRKAIDYHSKSLEIKKEIGDRTGEANCYTNLGNVYYSLGNFKEAIEYHSKSLKIMKEIGDKANEAKCYTNLGIAYQNLRDFKQAIEYFLKSLEIAKEIRDRTDEAKCYIGLGIAYQSLWDFKKAIEYYSKSLEIDKEIGDRVREARCYGELGNAYRSLGDFKQAIEYYLKSLEIAKEIGDRAGEASCYTNLGIVYRRLGDFKQAIEYHSKSLEIDKEIGDKASESTCYTNLGNVYQNLGDFKQAIEYHSKSLEIDKEIGDRTGEASCYTNLGIAYGSLGDFKQAIEYFLKSLEITKKIENKAGEASCYGNLGFAYQSLGDFRNAIEYHSKSLEIMKEIGDRASESIVYDNLGWVYYKQEEYQTSLNYIKQSLRIINLIKEELPYEDLSLYFLKSKFNTYELGIASALKLYDEKGYDKIYLLDALEIVERTKSRELVKQLGMKKKEWQLEKEYEKLEDIEYEIVCLNRKSIKTEEDRKRLNDLYEQKAKLQQEIYNKSLDPSTITPSIDESIINTFWERLSAYKDKSSVLEMYLHQDKILYFLFDEVKYEVFTQKITDDLTQKVREYLMLEMVYKLAGKIDLSKFYSILKDFSVLLFPNGLYNRLNNLEKENLFIIPHRWLHKIPFEAMVIDDKPLSIKYNLSRHYSLDLLKFSLVYPDKADDSALIISNPTEDLGDDEGIAVKDVLSTHYNNIIFLQREEASLNNVKNELSKVSLIHFDCHGVFNLENPLASKLLLSDQSLLASDIALTELTKYPIVFLNACESGEAGDRKEEEKEINLDIIGDEQIGFVRAFNLAKTPTVIVTHWAVNVEVAAKLAKYFYQELLTNGCTITEALKIAREKIYSEYQDKSRDWAAYCLYGNPFKRLKK